MTKSEHAHRLERLIEDVTVDCYNDDEAATAFCTAIEECLGGRSRRVQLAGFESTLVGVGHAEDRRGLVARIRHDGRPHEVALFDIEVPADSDPELVELLAAYREWCRW